MADEKPKQRLAREYVEVGRVWLDARLGKRVGTDPYPDDGSIRDYHLLSACHDPKTGYSVLIVVHKSKSAERDADAQHEDPKRRTFAVMRFIRTTTWLFRQALTNTLFGAKPKKGDSNAAPDDAPAVD